MATNKQTEKQIFSISDPALHNNPDTTRCIAQQQNVTSQQLRYLQKN